MIVDYCSYKSWLVKTLGQGGSVKMKLPLFYNLSHSPHG